MNPNQQLTLQQQQQLLQLQQQQLQMLQNPGQTNLQQYQQLQNQQQMQNQQQLQLQQLMMQQRMMQQGRSSSGVVDQAKRNEALKFLLDAVKANPLSATLTEDKIKGHIMEAEKNIYEASATPQDYVAFIQRKAMSLKTASNNPDNSQQLLQQRQLQQQRMNQMMMGFNPQQQQQSFVFPSTINRSQTVRIPTNDSNAFNQRIPSPSLKKLEGFEKEEAAKLLIKIREDWFSYDYWMNVFTAAKDGEKAKALVMIKNTIKPQLDFVHGPDSYFLSLDILRTVDMQIQNVKLAANDLTMRLTQTPSANSIKTQQTPDIAASPS